MTMQALPPNGPHSVAERGTGCARNRDTSTMTRGRLGIADASRVGGFAYIGNQMGGYGDPRARELTMALGRVVGA
jgi:hypothetical protein